jgi:hypothetical protein
MNRHVLLSIVTALGGCFQKSAAEPETTCETLGDCKNGFTCVEHVCVADESCEADCPYGTCEDGVCPFSKQGFFNEGPTSLNRFTDMMYCSRLHVGESGPLVSLGAWTVTGDVALRLALYTDDDGPAELVAQTDELTSVQGATTEGRVDAMVEPGDHWACLLVAGTLRFSAENITAPTYYGEATYGAFPSSAPSLTAADPEPQVLDLFVVTSGTGM